MANEFLGVGWKFPPKLDNDGKFILSKYDEDIREAILIILKTTPGERVMEPEFGCGIYEYQFASINISNLMLMEEEISKALLIYEPRIEVTKVKATPSDGENGLVMIYIDYIIIATNDRQNLVYPFYLTEGG